MASEQWREGYRVGFDAGKAAGFKLASETQAAAAAVAALPRKRPPIPDERRCTCGHADTTHNELGYCQARKDRAIGSADGCHCSNFQRVRKAPISGSSDE